MHDERSHPLLQQTPLSVNPFIDLPKPPTLPHNYTSLPSTLPPSLLNAAPSPSSPTPDLPAYVTSASFSTHPSTIIAQNQALLEQLERQKAEAAKTIAEWEEGIRERELAEKRRRAPGWLDSEARILEPEKVGAVKGEEMNLMDEPALEQERGDEAVKLRQRREVTELGRAMDRAFGKDDVGR